MQTGFISFCGKQSLNIKSNDTKKLFNDKLLNYGVQILHKHFQKYNDFTFEKIKSNPHIISLKSNGNPYYMFLTKFNETDICLMIDKKIQQGYFLPRMIIDRLSFDTELFEDTLIEGEMINAEKDNEWIFLMNDIIVHSGKKLESTNILKRLNILYDIIENKYFPLPKQKFSIQVKKYFKLHDIQDMLTFKDELNYSTRGIIFKPMFIKFKDILHNFDDSLIDNSKKIKYSETNKFIENIDKNKTTVENSVLNERIIAHAQNVIDGSKGNSDENIIFNNKIFNIEKTDKPDVYILYDETNKNVGIACIPTLKISKFLRKIFKDTGLNDKRFKTIR